LADAGEQQAQKPGEEEPAPAEARLFFGGRRGWVRVSSIMGAVKGEDSIFGGDCGRW